MPCYRPLRAFQCASGAVVFTELRRHDVTRRIDLACGQCVGCRLERSRQWATRCIHEKQLHKHNQYITITYDDEHLPENGNLRHRDFQLFIKRAREHERRKVKTCLAGIQRGMSPYEIAAHIDAADMGAWPPYPLSYYMCGEYGEDLGRPHYHAIIFNWHLPDKTLYKTDRGNKLYTSETLTQLWGKGHCLIGAVTFESAAYVARYIMKKITGQIASQHYEQINKSTGEIYNKKPEYNKMSLKPAIGRRWIEKYHQDVYPKGTVVIRGKESNAPKYYDKIEKKIRTQRYQDETAWGREQGALASAGDRTDERLIVRETVAKAKIRNLKRELK